MGCSGKLEWVGSLLLLLLVEIPNPLRQIATRYNKRDRNSFTTLGRGI